LRICPGDSENKQFTETLRLKTFLGKGDFCAVFSNLLRIRLLTKRFIVSIVRKQRKSVMCNVLEGGQ